MLINFWYPMALSEELAETPLKVKALGQELALFRDSAGKAHCLANTCVHRGGSLGSGKVVGDCIQCPYHGWQYAGDGRCRVIPTLGDGTALPSRAQVDSYPVQEKYGVVFAFLGDAPEDGRPPLLDIPEWDKEGWSVTHLVYDWNASFERVIENGLDATHTEFVHPSAGLQGNFKPHEETSMKLVETEWGSALQTYSPTLEIEHGHHGPSIQWTFLGFRMEQFNGNFRFYSFVRPIDEGQVRRYLFHARDFQHGEDMDEEIKNTTLGFELEDRPVIEDMQPRFSPRDTTSELLLPEDQIMVRFREWLDVWQGNGWHIDLDAVRDQQGRKIFALPSPGRRDSRSWILDTVPLLPGS